MRIENTYLFYSDFNCPFCYALNERLITMGDKGKIQWRGIEHMSSASSQDDSWEEKTLLVNEVAMVRKRAPEIPINTPEFRPNTGLANRLLGHLEADGETNLSDLRTAVYRAYWQEGRDISKIEVLRLLVEGAGFEYPKTQGKKSVQKKLARWQEEWQGERYHSRLPVMVSEQVDKPILGFPTFDLLYDFFAGGEMPVAPESLAVCKLRTRQQILLVGDKDQKRCDLTELRAGHDLVAFDKPAAALAWLAEEGCPADLVVIDLAELGEEGLKLCRDLRRQDDNRQSAVVVLMDEADEELELAAFDSGASDVMFHLANPKICQAKLEIHLRMKRSTALLRSLARLDYLTELPNRREFDQRFEEEWLRGLRNRESLSLVMIDIDHFKNYNDSYGHSAGDDCLRQVAQALRSSLMRAGDMVARFGGEEFSVLLLDTPLEGAVLVAERMCGAVREMKIPHEASSAAAVVTISAGAASMVPERGRNSPELLESADAALYGAKEAGRNQVAYSASLKK